MPRCKVKGCSGEAWHRLPRDKEKRRIWTDALNIEVQHAPNTNVMCTEHFQMLHYNDAGFSKGGEAKNKNSLLHHDDAGSSKGSCSTTSCVSDDDGTVPTIELETEDIPTKPGSRRSLPVDAVQHLRSWLTSHSNHPYPTEAEKKELMSVTKLSNSQVSNWFINARRRILPFITSTPNGNRKGSKPVKNSGTSLQILHRDRDTPLRTHGRSNSKKKTPVPNPLNKIPMDAEMSSPILVDSTSSRSNAKAECAFPDSTVSISTEGHVDDTRREAATKFRAKRRNVDREVNTQTKKGKVTVSPATSSQSNAKVRITSTCDSLKQPFIILTDDHNYTQQSEKIKPNLSIPAKQEIKPTHESPSSSGRRTKIVPVRKNQSAKAAEALLDSLYERLFSSSTIAVENAVPKIHKSPEKNETSEEPSNVQNSEVTETSKAECESISSLAKDQQTQTSSLALISHKMFQNKPSWVLYHTGLTDYEQFRLVLNSLGSDVHSSTLRIVDEQLPVEDHLLMTLMKLRRAEPDFGLSILFGVPKETVEKIFIAWINFMYNEWSDLDVWPSQELTVREVFHPTGIIGGNGSVTWKKPPNNAQERVIKLYKILDRNLYTHYKAMGDCILFVCSILHDFRHNIITCRKS